MHPPRPRHTQRETSRQCARRRAGAASTGTSSRRSGGHGRGVQQPHLAWRHSKSHQERQTPSAALLFHRAGARAAARSAQVHPRRDLATHLTSRAVHSRSRRRRRLARTGRSSFGDWLKMGGTVGRLDQESTTAQRAIDRPPAVSSPCRPAQGAVATVPTRTKPSGSPRRSRRTVPRTWQGK